MPDRFLLDTLFVIALLNPRDQYHDRAVRFFPRMRSAAEVWITESILVEIGDGLSAVDRVQAVRFINQCYQTSNIQVAPVDRSVLQQAIALYQSRPDKTWGLTVAFRLS